MGKEIRTDTPPKKPQYPGVYPRPDREPPKQPDKPKK